MRKLRWKLTLSYTVVTVGALLVVQLVLVGGGAFLSDWLLVRSGVLVQISQQIAEESYIPSLRPYLTTSPANREGIELWLRQFEVRTASEDDPLTMMVFDAAGTLLVTAPGQEGIRAELEPLIAAALRGEDDRSQLVWRDEAERQLWLATPVQTDGSIAGLLIQTVALPQSSFALFGEVLPILGISLIVVTVLAGIVGAVFGGLTARGLVNRLDNLTAVTAAWSRGDFTVFAVDRSMDELGQLAQRLNRMAEQIQHLLATRQQLAILEERNRLARDLHDSAKQQAFGVAAQLGAARALLSPENAAVAARIDDAERLAYDLRQELTNLVHQLRPVDLTMKGLCAALDDYARAWSQRNGIAVDIETESGLRFPAEIEEAFFRIAQEALANVARHSDAQQVKIRLNETPAHLIMQIGDDGRGFDPATVRRGVGLDSMIERSRSIHADLQLRSQGEPGTTITVRYGLKREKR
jgi:two-component system, NarL family, sensor histidine kinase LiaS